MDTYLITRYASAVCPTTVKVVRAENLQDLRFKLEEAGWKDIKMRFGSEIVLESFWGTFKVTNATYLGNEIGA